MKLAYTLGYSGARMRLPVETVREVERLGYDSVWTAEAYGSDAVTPLAYVAALTSRIKLGTSILQIPARTPAMTAMTMSTLDELSGGRAIVGLGLSGPQVVEGWHGQPFTRPIARVREYVAILRRIWARAEPAALDGEVYQLPYRGPDATGLGKPLKSILHGRQLPVYLAAMGPAGSKFRRSVASSSLMTSPPGWRSSSRTSRSTSAGWARGR
jgi:F420-dependent oxidoreductase-like protein